MAGSFGVHHGWVLWRSPWLGPLEFTQLGPLEFAMAGTVSQQH